MPNGKDHITLTFQSNIPIPDVLERSEFEKPKKKFAWPWLEMKEGDSILLPIDCPVKSAKSSFDANKRKGALPKNAKMIRRKLPNGQYRVWLTFVNEDDSETP